MFRPWFLMARLATLSLAAVIAWGGRPLRAEASDATVSLLLSRATAERREGDTLFRCDSTLDNATGRDLTVRTNFFSAFDGLELVVTTREGKTLAQQPYTFHQSPFTPDGRDFTIKRGPTAASLVFPIGKLPAGDKVVKVRLVGTLPGSEFRRILSTETLEVKIKE
jgi:hypothetical protein